jgi:hypothetical protein
VRPGTAALLDQAEAATTDAARIMAAIGALDGTPVRHTISGPIFGAMIGRLRPRAITGQLTLCPHLSYDAPQPALWCAWAPGRLRCTPCAHTTQKRIKGTVEDRRCDHCRRTGPTIHPDMAQLPAIVVDLPPWSAKCVPPVTLMFGLCPRCQQTDRHQEGKHTNEPKE